MSIHEHFKKRGLEPPREPADHPDFWRAFWQHTITPWDLGGPHAELLRREDALRSLAAETGPASRALVPGCGRGHDAIHLATAGWNVTAVDFAEETAPLVRERLAAVGGEFHLDDALEIRFDAPFDLWWEHTFFCAIPPTRRNDWGEAAARSVRAGGVLAAVIFPADKARDAGGPPFGIRVEDLDAALGTSFERLIDEPIRTNDHQRNYAERFALWRRRDA